MGSAPIRLNAGQQMDGISASSWNKFGDAWARVMARQAPLQKGSGEPVRPSRASQFPGAKVVAVYSLLGEDIPVAYPVVRLGDYVYEIDNHIPDPEDKLQRAAGQQATFHAEKPTDKKLDFAIVQGRLDHETSGTAVIQGLSWVMVNIEDPSHERAYAQKDVTWQLQSGDVGAKILYKEDRGGDLGPALCLVYLEGADSVMSVISGKCVEDVSPSEDIKIDNLEVLWGELPEGKEEHCENSEECEFVCRNIFEQQYSEDDVIVAFETIERSPTEIESPGHSNQSAEDHASQEAEAYADEPAEGVDAGGEIQWWGFGIPTRQRLFRTASTIGAAVYSPANSTLELGQGTAQIFKPTTPGSAILELEPDLLTIYSYVETEIQSGRNVMATLLHGKWIIHSEDCPAV